MKKSVFLIVILFLFSFQMLISQNLVPNDGFEDYSSCNITYGDEHIAVGWKDVIVQPGNYGADYFTKCAGNGFSVPSNVWGYQEPLAGRSYMVVATASPRIGSNYRENIYTKLSKKLKPNTPYVITFSLSKTDVTQYSSNNFGVKFSEDSLFPVDNSAHFFISDILTNAEDWTTYTGVFVADKEYEYMAIGNFFDDVHTDMIMDCPSCEFDHSTYYVDEVCVVESINLVHNYSFEEYSSCEKLDYGTEYYCLNWFDAYTYPGDLPSNYGAEYLNACHSGNFSVPQNVWGHQYAATGQAYMSLVTHSNDIGNGYRESIATLLYAAMIPSERYFLSFKINLADVSPLATNKFCMKFTTTRNFPIDNKAQFYNEEVDPNKNDWITVSTIYTADSSYKYLALGNYFDDSHTQIVRCCPNGLKEHAGYFFDDIIVVPLKGSCGDHIMGTSRTIHSQHIFPKIFPNPAREIIHVEYTSERRTASLGFSIVDVAGRIVKTVTRNNHSSPNLSIPIGDLSAGTYMLIVTEKQAVISSAKFLVTPQ